MNPVKKVIAYFLSGLVLVFAIIAILGIWDIVDLEHLLSRMFKTMVVILVASAVVVFIFAILIRDQHQDED